MHTGFIITVVCSYMHIRHTKPLHLLLHNDDKRFHRLTVWFSRTSSVIWIRKSSERLAGVLRSVEVCWGNNRKLFSGGGSRTVDQHRLGKRMEYQPPTTNDKLRCFLGPDLPCGNFIFSKYKFKISACEKAMVINNNRQTQCDIRFGRNPRGDALQYHYTRNTT